MNKFKHTNRTTKIFNSIIEDYKNIQSDRELEIIGLSYGEYQYIGYFLDCLRFEGEAETDSQNIANWMERKGCNVYMISDKWKVQL